MRGSSTGGTSPGPPLSPGTRIALGAAHGAGTAAEAPPHDMRGVVGACVTGQGTRGCHKGQRSRSMTNLTRLSQA